MYKIGQVVWLIDSETKSIEPVKVVSKQTLEDETGVKTFHNALSIDERACVLEKSEAAVFKSVEEAENHLLNLAKQMVSKLAETAKQKADVSFGTPVNKSGVDASSTDTEVEKSQVKVVELPDGTKARVHLPPAQS